MVCPCFSQSEMPAREECLEKEQSSPLALPGHNEDPGPALASQFSQSGGPVALPCSTVLLVEVRAQRDRGSLCHRVRDPGGAIREMPAPPQYNLRWARIVSKLDLPMQYGLMRVVSYQRAICQRTLTSVLEAALLHEECSFRSQLGSSDQRCHRPTRFRQWQNRLCPPAIARGETALLPGYTRRRERIVCQHQERDTPSAQMLHKLDCAGNEWSASHNGPIHIYEETIS